MSGVVVIRYAGDISGPSIADALLAPLHAKLERGRVEMDEHAQPSKDVNLEIVFRPGLRLGQVVEVHDALQGARYRGKITAITHNAGPVSLTTSLTLHSFEAP